MNDAKKIILPGFRREKASAIKPGEHVALWGPEGTTVTAEVKSVVSGPQSTGIVVLRDDTGEPVAAVFAHEFLLQVKE